jgi:hypothetical protein
MRKAWTTTRGIRGVWRAYKAARRWKQLYTPYPIHIEKITKEGKKPKAAVHDWIKNAIFPRKTMPNKRPKDLSRLQRAIQPSHPMLKPSVENSLARFAT